MSDPNQPAAAPSQAKGILLRHGSKGQQVHLRWDEPTIAEHDKLRGTRMKIDEEKTPYNYEMPADEEPAAPSAPGNGSSQQADAWGSLGGDLPGGDGDWESDDEDEVVPPAVAAPAAAAAAPAPPAGSVGPAAAGATAGASAAVAAAGASHQSGFAAARRAHYAEEVVNMKALLASGGAMADVDDDDDDDDDAGKQGAK